MEEVKDIIFEEMEELISSTGDSDPVLRKAHFLSPTIDKSLENFPAYPLSLSSNTTSVCLEELFPKMRFCAWRLPHPQWNKWVETMHRDHQETWKKSGIYEAVMCSMVTIHKQIGLIFGVAEKWCCETNTFVFPWGEATVTLEDMLVLGGFSVLGESVLDPLKFAEMKDTEETLIQCYKDIKSKTSNAPRPNMWIEYFTSKHDSKVEHDAFLCLWLSKYVFPNTKNDLIDKTVFASAVRLARGIRLALAPPVLARIYQDLGALKVRIVHSKKQALRLCAQLHLVQIWVWERFPSLRPKPRLIKTDEPRLAKWHELKKDRVGNMKLLLDTEGELFQWRPYVAKKGQTYFSKLYRENEGWVMNVVDSDMDSGVQSIARCVRVSELAGFECIEQYHPHRVAMQFGLDQDIPEDEVFNKNPKFARRNYTRPIKDEKLFVPSRLFESDVTKRYFDWWRNVKSVRQDDTVAMLVKKRPRSIHVGDVSQTQVQAEASEPVAKESEVGDAVKEMEVNVAALIDDDDDQLTINQLLRSLNAEKIHVGDTSPLLDTRVTETCMQTEKLEAAAALEELEAHQIQDPCNTRVIEAHVQSEEIEEFEAAVELEDIPSVKLLSSETIIRESEGVADVKELEAAVELEAVVEVTKENEKEIEIIDVDSFDLVLEDRYSYKVFMKSHGELAARISKLEQLIAAGLKPKYQRKGRRTRKE